MFKKEKTMLEQTSDDITKHWNGTNLFDLNVLLSRPLVVQEPQPVVAAPDAYNQPTLMRHRRFKAKLSRSSMS